MSAARVDMHRLQELVRLDGIGTGVRERARLLGMSTRTERTHRAALAGAGLLEGDSRELPEADALRAAVEAVLPQVAPQTWGHKVDPWLPVIRRAVDNGAGPEAVYQALPTALFFWVFAKLAGLEDTTARGNGFGGSGATSSAKTGPRSLRRPKS